MRAAAEHLGCTPANITSTEKRIEEGTITVERLARYVEACGGKLSITVKLPGVKNWKWEHGATNVLQ